MGRRMTMAAELVAALANLAPGQRAHLFEHVDEERGEDDAGQAD